MGFVVRLNTFWLWTDSALNMHLYISFRHVHSTVFRSHHALSLNEMGAVPGGAFRTFWEPVYRMSIPAKQQKHAKTFIYHKTNALCVFIRCTTETESILAENLAGPCGVGPLLLKPQSQRGTGSYTCRHKSEIKLQSSVCSNSDENNSTV